MMVNFFHFILLSYTYVSIMNLSLFVSSCHSYNVFAYNRG